MSLNFYKLIANHCTYFYNYDKNSFYISLLYINNIIVAGNSKCRLFMLKTQLIGKFDIKDLGAASQILSMKVLQERIGRFG